MFIYCVSGVVVMIFGVTITTTTSGSSYHRVGCVFSNVLSTYVSTDKRGTEFISNVSTSWATSGPVNSIAVVG